MRSKPLSYQVEILLCISNTSQSPCRTLVFFVLNYISEPYLTKT